MSFLYDDEMFGDANANNSDVSVESAPSVNTDAQDSANLSKFDSDVAEAIQDALGDQPWSRSVISQYAMDADASREAANLVKPIESKTGAEGKGIIGRISDFVDKNRGLTEMVLKGIAGAAGGNSAKNTANVNAKSQLEQLRLKNQLEQENNARVSASVTGMRPPGIMGRQQPLRRMGGANVYTNGIIR